MSTMTSREGSAGGPARPVAVALAVALGLLALVAPAAPAKARRHPSAAERTLARMAARHQLDPAVAAHDAWLLRDSRARARRLSWSARQALDGAADVADVLAAHGQLGGALAPVFTDLAANRTWFALERRSAPGTGARMTLSGSPLIYSFRPDAGWHVHPLANWGAINALLSGRHPRIDQARAYVDAMLALAVRRRGALVWEYFFPYAGARPGWVSAMPTAASLPALQKLFAATGDPRYAEAIQGALDLLSWTPPVGARLDLGSGRAAYLLYAQTPHTIVGNAFTQVLISLSRYVAAAPESPQRDQAQGLLDEGLAEARVLLPAYDAGTWSWYSVDPSGRGLERSDLHYHDFFTQLLTQACPQFGEPFCELGTRFATYPSLAPQPASARLVVGRARLVFTVTAAAEGSGRLSVWVGSRTVRMIGASVHAGADRFVLPRPSGTGPVRVKLEVTAMDGSAPATVQATGVLRPPPSRRHPRRPGH